MVRLHVHCSCSRAHVGPDSAAQEVGPVEGGDGEDGLGGDVRQPLQLQLPISQLYLHHGRKQPSLGPHTPVVLTPAADHHRVPPPPQGAGADQRPAEGHRGWAAIAATDTPAPGRHRRLTARGTAGLDLVFTL